MPPKIQLDVLWWLNDISRKDKFVEVKNRIKIKKSSKTVYDPAIFEFVDTDGYHFTYVNEKYIRLDAKVKGNTVTIKAKDVQTRITKLDVVIEEDVFADYSNTYPDTEPLDEEEHKLETEYDESETYTTLPPEPEPEPVIADDSVSTVSTHLEETDATHEEEQEIRRLNQTLDGYRDSVDQLQEQVQTGKEEFDRLLQQLHDSEKELLLAQTTLAEWKTKARSKVNSLRAELTKQKEDHQRAIELIQEQNQNDWDIWRTADSNSDEDKKVRSFTAKLQEENAQLRAAARNVVDQDAHDAALAEWGVEKQTLQDAITALQKENAELQLTIKSLRGVTDRLERENTKHPADEREDNSSDEQDDDEFYSGSEDEQPPTPPLYPYTLAADIEDEDVYVNSPRTEAKTAARMQLQIQSPSLLLLTTVSSMAVF